MTHDAPLVSICIPTFNRAGLLPRAVASAQAQTEANIEIVISDNASTDATSEVARRLAAGDARIRYACNERNLGMAGNWNRCLAQARAPLMCLLGDDDTLHPRAVAVTRDLLDRHGDAAIAFGAGRHCRASGALLRVNRPFAEERLLGAAAVHREVWLHNRFQLTHALFRTAAARAVGGFAEEVGWCADTDFILRLTARAAAAVTPEELGAYYVHPGQLTGTANRRSYRWKEAMVRRVMRDVAKAPELAALRPLAEGEYLSRYAIHFAAAAARRGRRDEVLSFLLEARRCGLPSSRAHRVLYKLLRAAMSTPGGTPAFRYVLAPFLRRVAARFA